MIAEHTNVRIIKGAHKGKTGIVKGHVSISPVQALAPGQRLSMAGAQNPAVIEFANGQKDLLDEGALEIITK